MKKARWSFRLWLCAPLLRYTDERFDRVDRRITRVVLELIRVQRSLKEVKQKMSEGTEQLNAALAAVGAKVDEIKAEIDSIGNLSDIIADNAQLKAANEALQAQVNELLAEHGVDEATIADLNAQFNAQNDAIGSSTTLANSILTKLGALDDELPGDPVTPTEPENPPAE